MSRTDYNSRRDYIVEGRLYCRGRIILWGRDYNVEDGWILLLLVVDYIVEAVLYCLGCIILSRADYIVERILYCRQGIIFLWGYYIVEVNYNVKSKLYCRE